MGALDAAVIFNGRAIGRVSRDPEYSGSCTAMFMLSIVRARAAAVRKTISELKKKVEVKNKNKKQIGIQVFSRGSVRLNPVLLFLDTVEHKAILLQQLVRRRSLRGLCKPMILLRAYTVITLVVTVGLLIWITATMNPLTPTSPSTMPISSTTTEQSWILQRTCPGLHTTGGR